MRTVIALVVWLVLFMIGIRVALAMVSAANTVENLLGFLLILIIAIISVQTKCLTLFKRKDEK